MYEFVCKKTNKSDKFEDESQFLIFGVQDRQRRGFACGKVQKMNIHFLIREMFYKERKNWQKFAMNERLQRRSKSKLGVVHK